jgi:gamma-glutamylcyclotransferase (GGCT)/AIG2-like uncharacterized protein YtfP/broad specificity phosphatase PhoE
MNKHLVFVYGSLRRGAARAMSIRFPNSKFIAAAKVSGSLYDLGAYPGLLLNESNSLVVGEAYEVDDETLTQLDDFEASSKYRRQQVEISFDDQRITGWTYIPESDSESYSQRTLITSGDWLEHARTKTDWPGAHDLNDIQEDAMAAGIVTTVILIRHADRDVPPAGTPDYPGPSLNDKGMLRARELVHVLSTAGIQAIYTSPYTRAKMTAKPFAAVHSDLPLVRLSEAQELKDHILSHHPGQTVLVVGHGNTVPELIGLLGGPSLPDIDDCEFDNLFVLVRHSATRASVTKLKYGAPTSAPC